MKTVLLIVFAAISFAVSWAFLIRARYIHKERNHTKRVLSAMQVYTIGIFAAVALVFIPIYYTSYAFGDGYNFVRPLLIALHNSLRIFILDGDFDIIVQALGDQPEALRICFSLHSAFLYVIAPILTFGNVLSLFANIRGELRYKWHTRKDHYIMSELNEKSVALAKSIFEKRKNVVIVFTDVFEQKEETDYELLTQARDMNAICLKRDISHLDFMSKKGNVELFLIGNNETENVSQAVAITTALNKENKKHNVKVFVFSSKPSAAYIVDSIRYEKLLQHAAEQGYGENCFKLRRIDEKQQLIWRTVPEMKLFELADRNQKTLSVLIVGFGSYGIEFFKMLMWYCQFEGYKLQISMVDKQGNPGEARSYIEDMIRRACPELLEEENKKDPQKPAEEPYDIQIFPGVDALTYDIDRLVLEGGEGKGDPEIAKRMQSTNLAFVSLGDDDLNIEVSIHLRSLFDRVNKTKATEEIQWEEETVQIYSVVYDNQKSGILYNEQVADSQVHLLRNHKDVPYHIHFIGSMSSQFDHQNIYDAELEKCAYEHHSSWVEIEEKIHNEWQDMNCQEKLDANDWRYQDEKNAEAVAASRKKYEQYEYYRRSSVAKELYRREIKRNPSLLAQTTCLETGNMQTCQCANCQRRKKSEHMRWNAYTRTIGFTYRENNRADRALLHDKLCPWEKLSEPDRLKD